MNYLLMAAEYFFPFIHVVLSERQLYNQTVSEQRYAYNGKSKFKVTRSGILWPVTLGVAIAWDIDKILRRPAE